jgi:hypothetical protein
MKNDTGHMAIAWNKKALIATLNICFIFQSQENQLLIHADSLKSDNNSTIDLHFTEEG